MSSKSGFSLILVISVVAAISLSLLYLSKRSAYALLTVKDYAQYTQYSYAHEALLFYAVRLAKHNWDFIEGLESRQCHDALDWLIDEKKKGRASIDFALDNAKIMHLKVQLSYDVYNKTITLDLKRLGLHDDNGFQQVKLERIQV